MAKVRGIKQPDGTPTIEVVFDRHALEYNGCVYISQSRAFDGLRNPLTPAQARKLARLLVDAADAVDASASSLGDK